MKKKIPAAGLLLLLLLLSGMTVCAKGENSTFWGFTFPGKNEAHAEGWERPELELLSGWTMNANRGTALYVREKDGLVGYCIEPGVHLGADGSVRAEEKDEYWWQYYREPNITVDDPVEIKRLIGEVLLHGYRGYASGDWCTQNPDEADKLARITATQIHIWEIIVGERDRAYRHIDPAKYGKDAVLDSIGPQHPLRAAILTEYARIEQKMQQHVSLPGFCSLDGADTIPDHSLSWDAKLHVWQAALAGESLGDYRFESASPALQLEVQGDMLFIKTAELSEGKLSIKVHYSGTGQERCGVVVWDGGDDQNIVTYAADVPDPVDGIFTVSVPFGRLSILKTADEGLPADGWHFTVRSADGRANDAEIVTDKNGKASLMLPVGTYEITELLRDEYAPHYIPADSVTVTLEEAGTEVKLHNARRKGSITVLKSDAAGTPVPQAEFALLCDLPADTSVTLPDGRRLGVLQRGKTDDSGRLLFDSLQPDKAYYLLETSAPEGFSRLIEAESIVLPCCIHEAEAPADGTYCADGKWYSYDAVINIEEAHSFVLPPAGAEGHFILPFLGSILLSCGTPAVFLNRKGKGEKHE